MPSVTDTMVPTLRASVTDLKFSIRCLIRSLISVALMAICVLSTANSLRSGGQFVGDALEARSDRAIDHQVPGAHDRATDEGRVDLSVQAYLALQALLERGGQLLLLRGVERRRGGHGDVGDPLRVVLQ